MLFYIGMTQHGCSLRDHSMILANPPDFPGLYRFCFAIQSSRFQAKSPEKSLTGRYLSEVALNSTEFCLDA